MVRYSFLSCVILLPIVSPFKVSVSVDYFINLINSQQSSWKAGPFFQSNFTMHSLTRTSTRFVFTKKDTLVKRTPCNVDGVDIPKTFDARSQWPECSDVIGRIGNQGHCNACWAWAATGVMSDRLCIQTKGQEKFIFSVEDLVSCCHYCDKGCTTGTPSMAWNYYINHGLVSGGVWGSYEGCKPYQYSEFWNNHTSTCNKTCDNPYYNISYEDDKHFGSNYYIVHPRPECIQLEILRNGPVQVLLALYGDLAFYKEGVYVNTIGEKIGTHSVRIIGWGEEKGMKYWLAANSWGCGWGLGGFFKIRRGVDECGIEQMVYAGNPRLGEQYPRSEVDGGKYEIKSEVHGEGFSVWVIASIVGVCLILLLIAVGVFANEKCKNVVKKYMRFR